MVARKSILPKKQAKTGTKGVSAYGHPSRSTIFNNLVFFVAVISGATPSRATDRPTRAQYAHGVQAPVRDKPHPKHPAVPVPPNADAVAPGYTKPGTRPWPSSNVANPKLDSLSKPLSRCQRTVQSARSAKACPAENMSCERQPNAVPSALRTPATGRANAPIFDVKCTP